MGKHKKIIKCNMDLPEYFWPKDHYEIAAKLHAEQILNDVIPTHVGAKSYWMEREC